MMLHAVLIQSHLCVSIQKGGGAGLSESDPCGNVLGDKKGGAVAIGRR